MTVLVDGSIWIGLLRGREELPAAVVDAMSKRRARICPVIWIEIYSGLKGEREEALARQLSELCPSLEIDHEVWSFAAELRRKAQRAGLNVPLTDVLIVACARRHGADLLHGDKHLESLLQL